MRYLMKMSVLAALVVLCGSAVGDIPQVISYQGKVTDTGGTPVPDGTYLMLFEIFNHPTEGTPLWSEGASVQVTGGIFNILLGESPMAPIDLDFDEDYWLLVNIAGDEQTPRQPLGSVGYAYMASGLVPGTVVSGAVNSTPYAPIKGENTASTGSAYGVYGQTSSTGGRGVSGLATAGTGTNFGLYGQSNSTSGRGVYGNAAASTGLTYGVYGYSASTSGRGVYGYVGSETGTTFGGRFESVSTSGRGVYGYVAATEGTNYGVFGESSSTSGRGVYGYAASSTGVTVGVHGESSSTSGWGVYGYGTASTGFAHGVYGRSASTSGRGVHGVADASTGITYGVYGQSASTSGKGVFGHATASTGPTIGVHGENASTEGTGVVGSATADSGYCTGVYGASSSTSGRGVFGRVGATTGTTYAGRFENHSTGGRGVFGYAIASTGTTYGVYGKADSPSGYGVWYVGGIGGSSLIKNMVRTEQGPVELYAQQATENWFEDFGEGRLMDGRAHVELDPLFLETVTINENNPMKVFVQLRGDCEGVYVKTGATRFDVVELQDGTSNAEFAYRVVAKRKGFEGERLEFSEAALTDSYLYPELREKDLRKLTSERPSLEEE